MNDSPVVVATKRDVHDEKRSVSAAKARPTTATTGAEAQLRQLRGLPPQGHAKCGQPGDEQQDAEVTSVLLGHCRL